MRGLLRRLGPLWRVQRQRHPHAAARVEAAALVIRGDLAGEVHALRGRVAELERDHLLLAAHVATLTEQVGAGARIAPVDTDADAARQRARLSAVAFYEERIGRLEERVGRLEERVGRPGHARIGSMSTSGRRIRGEQQETAS